MNEEIRGVIIGHLYDNLRGNPSRLLMLCRRLGHELVTLEDVNDELKALKDDGILEVHSAHRSNTVWMLSKVGKEAEQVRRHNLSVGFTPTRYPDGSVDIPESESGDVFVTEGLAVDNGNFEEE